MSWEALFSAPSVNSDPRPVFSDPLRYRSLLPLEWDVELEPALWLWSTETTREGGEWGRGSGWWEVIRGGGDLGGGGGEKDGMFNPTQEHMSHRRGVLLCKHLL